MSSPRNKTIKVNQKDYQQFPILKLPKNPVQKDLLNKIYLADANKDLTKLPKQSVDLIITDPPYTIRKNFGQGTLKQIKEKEFKKWADHWIKQCQRIIKPNGSIYICINWEASGTIEALLKKYFILQNRITWKREKGRGAKKNWKNNMEDIWFATKTDEYVFNLDQVKVKKSVIAPYKDQAGNPKDWQEKNGQKTRMTHPSNIWTDLVVPFWSMPENTQHPTQKPEKLIKRIITASSNKGALVFDPFMGSGTTAVVAKKLNRHFLGFEIEEKYYFFVK